MEYRIRGSIGEMPVDLVVEMPEVKRASPSAAKVGTKSDQQLLEAIDRIKTRVRPLLAQQGDALVELIASENKSGKTSVSRALREVWQPMDTALESGRYTREGLEHGMEVALAKGVPNIGYAKAVARGLSKDAEPVSVAVPKYRTVV